MTGPLKRAAELGHDSAQLAIFSTRTARLEHPGTNWSIARPTSRENPLATVGKLLGRASILTQYAIAKDLVRRRATLPSATCEIENHPIRLKRPISIFLPKDRACTLPTRDDH